MIRFAELSERTHFYYGVQVSYGLKCSVCRFFGKCLIMPSGTFRLRCEEIIRGIHRKPHINIIDKLKLRVKRYVKVC